MISLRGIATSVATTFFGVLIALGILEGVIRLVVPKRAPQGPQWSDRPLFYFRSPEAPTMQGYPHSATKPDGGFRIGVIGDSFTFAPYMQFTDTFASKLEQMLKVSGSPRPLEVVNYGVPAYSTSHEVGSTKTALREGADLIILQITLNDPELKPQQPTGIAENMPDKFGPMKLKGALGSLAEHWRTLHFVLARLHNTATHQAYIDYFTDLFENPRTWKPFVGSMKELVSQAKNAQKPIVAVVFPLFGLPMDQSYPFYPIHAKVAELMKSLGVPILDVSDIYKGIPLEHLQVIPGVDRHPNEIAHRMAAERIYLWLEEQGAIPQEFIIKEKFATRLGVQGQRPWVPPAKEAQ